MKIEVCPFCGEIPQFLNKDEVWGYSSAKIILSCLNQNCGINPHTEWEDTQSWESDKGTYFLDIDEIKNGLVKKWNKRKVNDIFWPRE